MKKEPLASLADNADLIAAILISVATLGTAWCALQSAIWNGLQTFHIASAGQASRMALFYRNEANRERTLDLMGYHALAQAYLLDQRKVVDFELSRYPRNYRDSLAAWFGSGVAARPRVLAFGTDSVVMHRERDAGKLEALSETDLASARRANLISDTYVLGTVLFSLVLFCAGIGSKFKPRNLQKYFLICAGAILLLSLGALLATPVSLSEWQDLFIAGGAG